MPLTIVDAVAEMAAAAVDLLQSNQIEQVRKAARDYTLNHYDWDHNLAEFERILTGVATS